MIHTYTVHTGNALHVVKDTIPVKIFRDEIETILLLEDGARLEWSEGGKTEEGFDHTTTIIKRLGSTVRCEWYRTAQDCDGRLDQSRTTEWTESDGLNEQGYPKWQDIDESQRDHTAESMGY